MRKWNILVAILVIAALAGNSYLLFSEKSKVPKTALIESYQVLKEKDYEEHLKKDAFVVPQETVTIHLTSEDIADEWLVREGDTVEAGAELVLLQTERLEGQVDAWSTERDALERQRETVLETIDTLVAERDRIESEGTTEDRDTHSIPVGEDGNVELNVNMAVGVEQSGSFAQAIAEAERDLAAIERQLTVLEFQIEQSYVRPAIISPVEGVVASVDKKSSRPMIEIYSSEAQVATFVPHEEWEKIKTGDTATVVENPLDEELEGIVDRVSYIPAEQAKKDRWVEAYEAYEEKRSKNPLDLYEIRVDVLDEFTSAPFGMKVDVDILVNEVTNAVAIPEDWVKMTSRQTGEVYRLTNEGKVEVLEVETPFQLDERHIVTDGVYMQDVIVHHDDRHALEKAEDYALRSAWHWPSWKTWKSFGWKNYIRYTLLP